jgi:MOSC domain-containing protein YiiM
MSGRLIGIARRDAHRAPMEELQVGSVSIERGLERDHKGAKFPRRQITVMSIEAWQAANAELADLAGSALLPWTTRRANFLVEGVELPRAKGGLLKIGPVELEVTDQTVPCGRMDEAHKGLLKALRSDWRGGVTCRVVQGGMVEIGEAVEILLSPPEHRINLPGMK